MTTACRQHPMHETGIEDRVRCGPSHAVLDALESTDVVLALWQRPMPPIVLQALDATASEALPAVDTEGPPSAVLADAEQSVRESGLALEQVKTWLLGDVDGLVHRVSRITGDRTLHLQLNVVSRDACRYFHIDAVPARLMCSYIGPGTQWIDPSRAGRESTGAAGTARILERPELIQHMRTGTVGVFRGGLGSPPGEGLVHRSPPIEATGERRFVLNITPVR